MSWHVCIGVHILLTLGSKKPNEPLRVQGSGVPFRKAEGKGWMCWKMGVGNSDRVVILLVLRGIRVRLYEHEKWISGPFGKFYSFLIT